MIFIPTAELSADADAELRVTKRIGTSRSKEMSVITRKRERETYNL